MILYRAISPDGCVTPGHIDVDPLLRNVAAAGLVAALPFADLDRDLEVVQCPPCAPCARRDLVHHHVVINQPRANH